MSRANLHALQQRISEALEQIEQDKAKLKQLKAHEQQLQRTAQNRRKVLAGAVVLSKAEKDPAFAAQLQQWLEEGLFAERDRAVFGLAVREQPDAGKLPASGKDGH